MTDLFPTILAIAGGEIKPEMKARRRQQDRRLARQGEGQPRTLFWECVKGARRSSPR